MSHQPLPRATQQRICELRARDVLWHLTDHEAGEPWTYGRIQEELGLASEWPIGKYAGRAGLTSRTPEPERIRKAMSVLGLSPGPAELDQDEDLGDQDADVDVDVEDQDAGAGDVEYEMELDETGIDGFLPDTSADESAESAHSPPRGGPVESDESSESAPPVESESGPRERPGESMSDPSTPGESESGESAPPVESERSIAFRYTCRGCSREMRVYTDELGKVVDCPYEDCQRPVEMPTHAQLVKRGVVLS